MSERPTVSAIVIAWNGMRFVPDCFRTLTEDLKSVDHELIVVDNGSTDGTPEYISEHYPQVKLIRKDTNLGFAKAVNIGLKAACGEFLYILNQDLRFRPGTVRGLVDRIRQDDSIGLIGPGYVDFDGRRQGSARAFPTFRHIWYKAFLLSDLFPRHREFASWKMGWFDHETELFVDQPMGAVMLVPQRVVKEVGLMDESFVIFFNDVDWCRRIKEAGYRLLYYPGVTVEHFVGGSTRTRPIRMAAKMHRAMYRYLAKYARWYQYPLLWLSGLALAVGLIPQMLLTVIRRLPSSGESSD